MSDFNFKNYYKKSSFSLRIARYVVTFLFIIFIISCILVFRSDVTVDNIQLLSKFISLDDGSSLFYTEEFSVTATDEAECFMLRDNLGILNGSNFSLYYLSGQKLFSYDLSYSSPAAAFNDHNILCYDVGGNNASIFNSFSKLKSFEFEFPILSAYITKDHLAVATSDDTHKSAVIVYEYLNSTGDYEEIFRLYSSEKYVTNVCLTDDGDKLLVCSSSSKSGSFDCSISIYDVYSDSASPVHSVKITNELPIKAQFSNDADDIFAVTDSGVIFFDENLSETSSHRFNQSKTEAFYIGNDLIVLTERNNLSGNSMLLTGLSKDGDVVFSINTSDEIRDVAFAKDKIFALGDDGVYEYSKTSGEYKLTNSSPLASRYNSIVSDKSGNCYIISNSYVKRIDF